MSPNIDLILLKEDKSCLEPYFHCFLIIATLLYIIVRLALLFTINKIVKNILDSPSKAKEIQIKLKYKGLRNLAQRMLHKLEKVHQHSTEEQCQKHQEQILSEEEKNIQQQLTNIQNILIKINKILLLKLHHTFRQYKESQTLNQKHQKINNFLEQTLICLLMNLKMKNISLGIIAYARIIFYLSQIKKFNIILKNILEVQNNQQSNEIELSNKSRDSLKQLQYFFSIPGSENKRIQQISQALRQIKACQVIRQNTIKNSTFSKITQQFFISEGDNKYEQSYFKPVSNQNGGNDCEFNREKFKIQLNSLLLRGMQRDQAKRKKQEDQLLQFSQESRHLRQIQLYDQQT